MIEAIFVVCIIVLIILWGYELYTSHNLEHAYNETTAMAHDFVEAFNQVKEIVNSNATSLKQAHELIAAQGKIVELLDNMQGFQNEVLKISPDLRARLAKEADIDSIAAVADD